MPRSYYERQRNRRANKIILTVTGGILGVLALIAVIGAALGSGKTPEPPSPGKTQAIAAAEPTFAYPGNRQCAITYRADPNGTMSWTATVTVPGRIITHASDRAGAIFRRIARVTPGPNLFSAPVPLAQVDDIGGVLYGRTHSYACSIAPAR